MRFINKLIINIDFSIRLVVYGMCCEGFERERREKEANDNLCVHTEAPRTVLDSQSNYSIINLFIYLEKNFQ